MATHNNYSRERVSAASRMPCSRVLLLVLRGPAAIRLEGFAELWELLLRVELNYWAFFKTSHLGRSLAPDGRLV